MKCKKHGRREIRGREGATHRLMQALWCWHRLNNPYGLCCMLAENLKDSFFSIVKKIKCVLCQDNQTHQIWYVASEATSSWTEEVNNFKIFFLVTVQHASAFLVLFQKLLFSCCETGSIILYSPLNTTVIIAVKVSPHTVPGQKNTDR